MPHLIRTFLPLLSIQTIVDTPFIQLVLRSFAAPYFAWAHHSQAGMIKIVLLGSIVIVNTNAGLEIS